ncbi:MAG: InlB B-repeat-containing protein [Spirochaetaceae bacterium]|jgi:hypothetical protein|nr:InlB B-repeat-containing protein [Spirochaetaceae bacterium]
MRKLAWCAALVIAAVFVAGCDGIYTLRDYLEERQKRREEASPAPAAPSSPEIPHVPGTPFVPVEDITGIPDEAVINVPLALSPEVAPENATNKTVEWSLVESGTTGAVITGGVFTAIEEGTAVIRATVVNGTGRDPPEHFTKDFSITVRKATTPSPTTSQGFVIHQGLPDIPFTLTNTPPFADNAVWKVYASADGDALASEVSGVDVAVSGSTLTLSHPSGVPTGTYYVSVTEPGKDESSRLALYVVAQYPITYNTNGGTLPDGAPAAYWTYKLPLTLPTPALAPYVFLGWYDNPQFQGSPVTAIPAGSNGSREFWALWRSRTPAFSIETVDKGIGAAMADVPFTLTNDPPFTENAVWKVYAAASGDALASEVSGVDLAVSGSTLTLSHPSDVPTGAYYVTVTESGKAESLRLAIYVIEGPPTINVGSPASAGPQWFYTGGVITLRNGANVILTGSTGTNRVAVESGAAVTVTLQNATIAVGGTMNNTAFNGSGADVTLLLAGTNYLSGKLYGPAAGIGLAVGTSMVIDSAASTDAGTDASSRSTLGTLSIHGFGYMPGTNYASTPAIPISGNITQLGGVVIALGVNPYNSTTGLSGALTAEGGVFISYRITGGLSRPSGSKAAVFVSAAPSTAYQNDHTDLVACGSEVSIPAVDANISSYTNFPKTITLNAPLTIPDGVTLRIPSGWTLNTGGNLTNNGTVINNGTITP